MAGWIDVGLDVVLTGFLGVYALLERYRVVGKHRGTDREDVEWHERWDSRLVVIASIAFASAVLLSLAKIPRLLPG